MTDFSSMEQAIAEAKAEKKKAKDEYGKRSIEYAEAREQVRELKDALDFALLHD